MYSVKAGTIFYFHIFLNILLNVLHMAQYVQTEGTPKPVFGFEVNQSRRHQAGHSRIEL